MLAIGAGPAVAAITDIRTITADNVRIDTPILNNRLRASNLSGMMQALRRDVSPIGATNADIGALTNAPAGEAPKEPGMPRRSANTD